MLLASTSANAIGWNTISNLGNERVKPKEVYNLDTSGNTPRVYEWTPKGNKNVTCVFVAGTKSSGVACYKN